MRSDAATLAAFLRRVDSRRAALASVNAAAAGLVLGAIIAMAAGITNAMMAGSVIIAAALVLAAGVRLSFRFRGETAAAALERRAPESRNLIVTAAELLPVSNASYVSGVVMSEAASLVRSLDARALFPARRAVVRISAAIALAVASLGLTGAENTIRGEITSATGAAAISRVDVRVTPPSYTGRPARELRDPMRVEAIAGSRITVTVRASAGRVALETLNGRRPFEMKEARVFTTDVTADADGFLSIEAGQGDRIARRIIGLSVTPDASPRVRIAEPDGDLLVGDAMRSVSVAANATDDFGVASLALRYTKVSGSGEQFTFTEGEIPLTITRDSSTAWRGRTSLALASFKLEPGDMLVYRAVATDARPGAPLSESDTYIIEISAPGGVAAAGFAIDDERDRYGLSQQMVISKTQQLIARRAAMSADSVADVAIAIAAEQRAVRAEFVFMMGGELAEDVMSAAGVGDLDETAEAEAEGDILAGRLANRGRLEMVRAIRSMSRAATALNTSALDSALVHEKAALTYLEGAFSRARYILRALTERERLDLSRRLSGSLAGVFRDVRPSRPEVIDSATVTLRHLLADLATLGGAAEPGIEESSSASELAQAVLRVDPSSAELQKVASALQSASRASAAGRAADAREAFADASVALAATVRGRLGAAPPPRRGAELDELGGRLTDALRARER